MREPRYSAGPYRMRNDAAWMVYDDHGRRVVMLRLNKPSAVTLAHTLNVAELDAPPVEEQARATPAKRAEAKKKADAKKT